MNCVRSFSQVGGWSHCEPRAGTTFISCSMCRWLQAGRHWWPRTARSTFCWCICFRYWWVTEWWCIFSVLFCYVWSWNVSYETITHILIHSIFLLCSGYYQKKIYHVLIWFILFNVKITTNLIWLINTE